VCVEFDPGLALTESPRLSFSAAMIAPGASPIPDWMIAPSGIRLAVVRAIRSSAGDLAVVAAGDSSGASMGIPRSIRSTGMVSLSRMRGMRALRNTMRCRARGQTIPGASQAIPNEQFPPLSGGAACRIARLKSVVAIFAAISE
jgi:hypothetical protein